MVDFPNIGRKIYEKGKRIGEKITKGVKGIGQKIYDNKELILALAGAGAYGTWLGKDKWSRVVGGAPRLEQSAREDDWIMRDLRRPITGDSPPPPTYSQLFPQTRGEFGAQYF